MILLTIAFYSINYTNMEFELHVWISIKSYLSNRKQYVSYYNCISPQKDMQSAPGINSGPSAFLIYVNDMAKVSSLLCSILFADDTNLFISGKHYLICT